MNDFDTLLWLAAIVVVAMGVFFFGHFCGWSAAMEHIQDKVRELAEKNSN